MRRAPARSSNVSAIAVSAACRSLPASNLRGLDNMAKEIARFALRRFFGRAQDLHRRMAPIALAATMVLGMVHVSFAATTDGPIRIALTKAVFVDDSVAHDRWARYLEKRLQRPVQFVQRKTYNDIQQLLRLGEVDFAWICGYPYVLGERESYLKYVATPTIHGDTSYKIYLIVPSNSPARSLADLRGKIFAFSDPDSVSFHALVDGFVDNDKPIQNLDEFFKIHFFTYDHVSTIQAVADGLADGGSVDSHVWEAQIQLNPTLTSRARVVATSEQYALPPIVASWRTPNTLVEQAAKIFENMEHDPEGKAILELLQATRFITLPQTIFDTIRNGPAKSRLEKPSAGLSISRQ